MYCQICHTYQCLHTMSGLAAQQSSQQNMGQLHDALRGFVSTSGSTSGSILVSNGDTGAILGQQAKPYKYPNKKLLLLRKST